MGDITTWPLKGTPLRGSTSYDVLIVKIGPPVRPVRCPRNQKNNSHRSPTSSNRNTVWHGGWSPLLRPVAYTTKPYSRTAVITDLWYWSRFIEYSMLIKVCWCSGISTFGVNARCVPPAGNVINWDGLQQCLLAQIDSDKKKNKNIRRNENAKFSLSDS